MPSRLPSLGTVGSAGGRVVVAHGAGNRLDALRAAEAAGVAFAEADVHLFRGRLKIRHLKTLGRVPVLGIRRLTVSARCWPLLEAFDASACSTSQPSSSSAASQASS